MIIQFDEKYKSFPKEEYELHVEKLQTEMKKMNLDLLHYTLHHKKDTLRLSNIFFH